MAKRVNTRFLTILTLSVMGLLIAAMVLTRLLGRQDPAELIRLADQYVEMARQAAANPATRPSDEARPPDQLLREARDTYGKALRIRATDPELLVKFGDVRRELTRYDLTEVGKDVQAWQQAVEIDPGYLPALQRLLDVHVEYAEVSGTADVYGVLGQRAEALARARAAARINDNDIRPQAYQHIAVIGAWLAGKATPELVIEKEIESLLELMKLNPALPEVPMMIARARMRLAADYAGRNNPEGAFQQVQQAIAAFDEPLKKDGDNPVLLLHYFRIAVAVLGLDQERELDRRMSEALKRLLANTVAVVDEAQRPAAQQAMDEAVAALTDGKALEARRAMSRLLGMVLEKAARLVRPEQPEYIDVRLTYSDFLMREGREGLEKAIESLTPADDPTQLPAAERWRRIDPKRADDQQIRLQLASCLRLDPKRHQEAVELLARPFGANPDHKSFKANLTPTLELRRLVELAGLRLEIYRDAGEGQRPGLKQQIENDYARAISIFPAEHPALLQLRGKMLLTLDGSLSARYEAIRLLQSAYDKLEGRRVPADLVFLLARCYMGVNETGQAKSLFAALLQRQPGNIVARQELARLLISDRDYAAAEPHVKLLEQRAGDETAVKFFRIELLRAAGNVDQAKALAAGLPQASAQEQLVKAQALLTLGDTDTSVKLLTDLSRAELVNGSTVYPASQLLARAYLMQKKLQEAGALIAQVQRAIPENLTWRGLAALAREAKPEELEKLREEYIEGIEDQTARALHRYRMLAMQARDEQALDAALNVLLEAEKKVPDSGPILDTIFNHLLRQKQFERAEQYAARLTQLNFDQVGGLTYQTRMKLARNDAEGALSGAMEVSRRLPEFSRSWTLLGEAQELSRQHEAAIVSYGKALDRQVDNAQALLGLVRCHLTLGQDELARQRAEQGKKLGIRIADWDELMNRLDEQRGDLEALKAATARREKALEQNPDRVENWIAVADDYNRLATRVAGQDLKAAGPYLDKVRATFSEAIKKWPDNLEVNRGLSDILLRTGNAAESLAILEKLASSQRWKDKPEPMMLLARYYERLGEEGVAKAEESWLAAGARAPRDMDIQSRIADFYMRVGQLEKAIGLLEGIAQQTNDLDARRKLVQVQLTARKFADAEKLLEAVLRQTPSDPAILSLLGYVKGVRGDYADAGRLFEQALKIDGNYPYAFYYRGIMHGIRGDLSSAVADLERARSARPRDPDFRSSLADAYRRRNQIDDATRELETAVQLAPQRADLRLKLVHLYAAERRWVFAQRLIDQAKADPELNQDPLWLRTESMLWLEQGELQKAYDAIFAARKLAPQDPAIFNEQLSVVLKAKGYKEVIQMTDPLIASNRDEPTLWWVYAQRGLALHGLQKPESEVRMEFDRAMSLAERTRNADEAAESIATRMAETLGPKMAVDLLSARRNIRWKIATVRVLAREKNWARAIQTMDQLLGEDYESLSAFQKLFVLRLCGPIYHAAGADVPEALAKAEQAYNRYLVELGKHHLEVRLELEALNNLALLLAEHPHAPNPQKALTFSRRAYEIMEQANDFNPGVADTHGWILVLCGKTDEGVALLRRAADRQSVDAYYHLGRTYLKLSRPAEAARALEQAQALLGDPKVQKELIDPEMARKIETLLQEAKQKSQAAPPGA